MPMPTDIGYTGQRLDSYIKLVQMGARWYSPILGRWLSPDSIVPQPVNPQDFNRYGYTRNNPLKYVDPSGHFTQCNQGNCYDDGYSTSNPWITSYDAATRRLWLGRYADQLAAWAMAGWITSLDGLEQLSNFAASLIPNDTTNRMEAYVNDMSQTIMGVEGSYALIKGFLHHCDKCPEFGDTGFHRDYRDQQNQVYHYWAYVATVALQNNILGRATANLGNTYHEFIDPIDAANTIIQHKPSGLSWEDYYLARAGWATGELLAGGKITVNQAGSFMRMALSTEYPGTGDDANRAVGLAWTPGKAVETLFQAIYIDWYYYWPK